MKPKVKILQLILTQGVLPLFYHEDFETSLEIITAMYRAGIRAVEYTNRGKAAIHNFRLLKEKTRECFPDLLLGIGTIKTINEARRFIEAESDFIVSPLIDPRMSDYLNKEDLLWIPGAMTPTEIFNAQNCGALLIKIFPANVVGPGFLSSIREVFPGQLFMVTGGAGYGKFKNLARIRYINRWHGWSAHH